MKKIILLTKTIGVMYLIVSFITWDFNFFASLVSLKAGDRASLMFLSIAIYAMIFLIEAFYNIVNDKK